MILYAHLFSCKKLTFAVSFYLIHSNKIKYVYTMTTTIDCCLLPLSALRDVNVANDATTSNDVISYHNSKMKMDQNQETLNEPNIG